LKHLFRVFLLLVGMVGFAQPSLADRLPFLVPTKTIYPGQIIPDAGLNEKLFYIKREAAPLYASKISQVAGKTARRTLVAGKPIAMNALSEPVLVERGQSVRMVFSSGSLTISSTGIALSPAGVGDVVRLRNIDSGVVVSGRVAQDGHVEIGEP